ncbi:chaperonin 10-like protein [Xylogone sp. PMI_703]|nr:chaperonin 10-like protein [Xylogone sp. PMI_703]
MLAINHLNRANYSFLRLVGYNSLQSKPIRPNRISNFRSISSFSSKITMPSNSAAVLAEAKGYPLQVKEAAYTSPGENEILVKNGAVAINPMDWLIQVMGPALFPWLQYPFTGGSDLAGEVVEVGSGVTRFKVGDRVIGHALGFSSRNPREAAFQNYTVLQAKMASPIPSDLSYESATVIPLALSTAACGLFQKDFLALDYPSLSPKPNGEILLIWAGSSSVGGAAIQLATAAGYEVITTCSPKNFDYVKKLGASQAFDYHDTNITNDLLDAFKGKKSAGAVAILPGSLEVCFEVVAKSEGKKFVAAALPLPAELPSGVQAKFIFSGSIKDTEVGSVIYEQYLPKALVEKKFIAAPEPEVVGKGLESLQAGYDALRKGVSAKKVVVSL